MARGTSGKIQISFNDKLKNLYSLNKIAYADDGLLTQDSVDYLKHCFRSDGIRTGERNASHTKRHDGGLSDTDMIEALYIPNAETGKTKAIVTQFPNERTQWTAIIDTICDHSDNYLGFHADSNVPDGTRFQYTTESDIDIHNGTDMVGWTRANGFLYKCDTEGYVSVVTNRDKHAPLGITIQTAYPGIAYDPKNDTEQSQTMKSKLPSYIRQQYMELESADYRDIMRKTKMFQNAESPIEKANLLMQANPSILHGCTKTRATNMTANRISISDMKTSAQGVPRFYIHQRINNDERYCCIVEDDNVYIQKMNDKTGQMPLQTDDGRMIKYAGTRYGSLGSIQHTLPDLYRLATTAQRYIDTEKSYARGKSADTAFAMQSTVMPERARSYE